MIGRSGSSAASAGRLRQPGLQIGIVAVDQSAIFTGGHGRFLLFGGRAYGRSGEREPCGFAYSAPAPSAATSRRGCAAAGNEVSVVARGAHLEAIRARGLTLLAGDKRIVAPVAGLRPAGRARAAGRRAGDPEGVGPASARADASRPLLGADTPVAFVQNGIPWWYGHGLVPGAAAGARPVAARSRRRARQGGRPRSAWSARSSARPTTSSSRAWCITKRRTATSSGSASRTTARRRASRRCARP